MTDFSGTYKIESVSFLIEETPFHRYSFLNPSKTRPLIPQAFTKHETSRHKAIILFMENIISMQQGKIQAGLRNHSELIVNIELF